MRSMRWLYAAGLTFLTCLSAGGARAQNSEIQDRAGLFSPHAIEAARTALRADEKVHQIPTVIETVNSLEGVPIEEVALQHARASGIQGVFVLIPRAEHKIAVLGFRNFLGADRCRAIEASFAELFRTRDFDGGLQAGVKTIGKILNSVPPPARNRAGAPDGAVPVQGRPAMPEGRPVPQKTGSGVPIVIIIGVVVLIAFAVIRALSRAGSGAGYGGVGPKGPMPGPGYGAGPGYGGPGYGGRGGGFMSSLFGGLGGAIAGNWLYNQMSGGHHHDYGRPSGTDAGPFSPSNDSPGTDWGGTSDGGTDWGGSGGGTDWGGGGDVAGGGDWGGGGGDWGGGGGSDWT